LAIELQSLMIRGEIPSDRRPQRDARLLSLSSASTAPRNWHALTDPVTYRFLGNAKKLGKFVKVERFGVQ